MYALGEPAPARIDVHVWAADPLSRAGTIAQLRGSSWVRVVDEEQVVESGVALVVADEVDAEALRAIRSLRRRGAAGVALLVTRLDDRGLLSAVEAGVGGVLRRSQATVGNVVSTIRSVAAGEGTLPPDMLARLLEQVGQLQRQVLAPRGLTFSGLDPARAGSSEVTRGWLRHGRGERPALLLGADRQEHHSRHHFEARAAQPDARRGLRDQGRADLAPLMPFVPDAFSSLT